MKNPLSQLLRKMRSMSRVRRGTLLVVAALGCLLLLARFNSPAPKTPGLFIPQTESWPGPGQPDAGDFAAIDKLQGASQPDARSEVSGEAKELSAAMPYRAPLIAQTAQLLVATKEFAKSRSSLEEILERHRGYAARLRMTGRRSGSVLSATLRIPSPELSAAVSELKSLGDVESEEENADEVTQQRANLEARLANAEGTLRRLQELLKKQTYPDGNVRELQRQIAAASAEVNRLEAERLASEHRVIFANVQFSLREQIPQPAETLGSQLHAAAEAGFGQAAASISALLLFLIGRGPVVLLWFGILYLPARYLWRRSTAAPGVAGAQAGQA